MLIRKWHAQLIGVKSLGQIRSTQAYDLQNQFRLFFAETVRRIKYPPSERYYVRVDPSLDFNEYYGIFLWVGRLFTELNPPSHANVSPIYVAYYFTDKRSRISTTFIHLLSTTSFNHVLSTGRCWSLSYTISLLLVLILNVIISTNLCSNGLIWVISNGSKWLIKMNSNA